MRKKKKFNISLLTYVLCAIMIIIIIPCVSDISGDVFRSKGRMSGYEEDSLYNDFIENNYEGLLEKTEYNTGIGKYIDKDGVLHRRFQNVIRRAGILIAPAEVSLQDALILAVDGSNAHPAKITNEHILIRTQLMALLCQLLLVELACVGVVLQTGLVGIHFYHRAVVGDHGVHKEHQK